MFMILSYLYWSTVEQVNYYKLLSNGKSVLHWKGQPSYRKPSSFRNRRQSSIWQS